LLEHWKRQHEAWVASQIAGDWAVPYTTQFPDQYAELINMMMRRDSMPERHSLRGTMLTPGDSPSRDQDAARFAETISAEVNADDANADNWAALASSSEHTSLAGRWKGRWIRPTGRAMIDVWNAGDACIRMFGDQACIDFHDGKSAYLIVAWLSESRLVGRYINCTFVEDCLPWVGQVVGNTRIDGFWPLGRWDFRR
jgi:hypothetical protein